MICDIVIPIWNQLALTRRCLESLLATTPEPVCLILVDNGSDPSTRQYLEEFKKSSRIPVRLIRNEKNLGFIKGTNQGIRAGDSAWVCLLNNDTVTTHGWLTQMLRVAMADPAIGLVNPTSNSLGFHTGGTSLDAHAAGLKKESGKWTPLTTALGFCLLARRTLFDQIGLLDESFGMGYFDDDDLSRRVKEKGYRCVRSCAAYVFHEEKGSFQHLPETEQIFQENQKRFERRWGRHLRILWDPWALDPETALKLAGEGHWLTFVTHPERVPEMIHSHAQINFLNLRESSWRPRATVRLLMKRKKPFDLVISHDPHWSRWVGRLTWLHRARLLHQPTSQQIFEQCRLLLSNSRSWSASKETQPLPAATSLPLSVVVITKNEAKRLAECLDSVRWADEILVVDDESTDRTEEVARRYTDKILHRKMDMEGRHRNWAAQQARNEWILSIDADERVTPELAQEIQALLALASTPSDIYSIPRRNYIGRHWVRFGGWYPSPQVKLFKKSVFQWEETTVHPRAISRSQKPWGVLRHDLIHYSYRDLTDFFGKLNRQTTLETQKWIKDARRMSLGKALWRSVDRFIRSGWGKRGTKDGFLGFIVAANSGMYQFLSYAKYWHLKENVSARGEAGREGGSGDGVSGPSRKADYPGPALPGRKFLSVVVLTKNAQEMLPACLASVSWADETIVVDGGSTDGTVEAARGAQAQVIHDETSDNFAHLRNMGSQKARGDWILQLDADEVVTPDFRKAIEEILGDLSKHAAYKFRRRNFFLGHWMRFGGWDHQSLHLFRKGLARYEGRVHERLFVQGTIGSLRVGVDHYPFRTLEEFLDRQNRYTSLQALDRYEKEGPFPMKEIWRQTAVRPVKLFWKIFVKKQGFRNGRVGLIFAALFAFVELMLWAKVWEIQDGKSRAA